jgi:hypothetical protein
MSTDTEKPLTPKEAAKHLGISIRCFWRYRLNGSIPPPDVCFGTRKSQRWYKRTLDLLLNRK